VLVCAGAWFFLELTIFHDAFSKSHPRTLRKLAFHLEVLLPISYCIVFGPWHKFSALSVLVNEMRNIVLREFSSPRPVISNICVRQLVASYPEYLVALAFLEVRLNNVLDRDLTPVHEINGSIMHFTLIPLSFLIHACLLLPSRTVLL
jgi:hypothetical protein